MLQKRIIVELSPSRLGATVWQRGRVTSSLSERHDAARFREDWAGAVGSLAAPLKQMVESLGVRGRPAMVVYHSPSAVCGVFPCPLSAGRAAWLRSSRLAVLEAASFPAPGNPVDCALLARDAVSKSGSAASQPSAHTLGVAESHAVLDVLAQWAASAGLSPEGFVPAGAVALAAAVRRALIPLSDAAARIVLNVGEHASVLAIGCRGRLTLVRQLGFGTEMLAEGLARVLAGGSTPPAAARDQARSLLNTIGLPAREQIVDPTRNVTGGDVLPVLQPLLQRLLIEAKQSLRFGLPDGDRGGSRLEVSGEGAGVPGLAAMVAAQTGTTMANTPMGPEPTVDPRRTGVLLVPRSVRATLHTRAATRGLWTGAGAAAAFVAYLAVDARTELADLRARLADERATLSESEDVRAMVDRLTAARTGLTDARRRMDAAFAGVTDWSALLTAIAEQTPESVSLGTIELTIDRDQPLCRVRGQARAEPGGDPTAVARSYLDRLMRLPIVRECRLGSTQRLDDEREPRQAFVLTLTLVELPQALTQAEGGAP